jgi:hypothetical protein
MLQVVRGFITTSVPITLVCPEQGTSHGFNLSLAAPYIALVGVLLGLLIKWRVDIAMQKRDMKRSAYMDVASALHECVRTIASLVNPKKPVAEIGEQFAVYLEPVSKAQVVADMPLSAALMDLTAFLNQVYQALALERVELDPLHRDYEYLQGRFKRVAEDIDAREADLQSNSIEGAGTQERNRHLLSHLKARFAERERLRDAMEETGKQAGATVIRICTVLAEQMREFPELNTRILNEIRKELGFAFDASTFLVLQRKNNELGQKLIAATSAKMAEITDAEKKAD